jgi:putative membrane protein
MKKSPALRALPLAVALSLGCGWAAAQSPAPTTPAQASQNKSDDLKGGQKLSHGDRKFIEDAAKGGMFEVQSAQVAQSKATDPAVKDFAGTLLQDHQKANDELKQIAQSKGVQLPQKLDWGQGHELKKLKGEKGKDFDREFAQHSVKDHEKDVKKFEKAAKDLKDPDVKAWAEKTLPVLRKHLEMAQNLPESKGNGSQASANGHSPAGKKAG